jgi:ribonuclease P protein component
MRRSGDFTSVVRAGARTRRGCLVVHVEPDLYAAATPKIGLVVGKSVGGSVVRHRVARRLRGQLATRLAALPEGSGVVVRALPDAASATSTRLGADLDAAFGRLLADPARFVPASDATAPSQLRAQVPSGYAGRAVRAGAHRDGVGEAR